jgi:hypothetical protein
MRGNLYRGEATLTVTDASPVGAAMEAEVDDEEDASLLDFDFNCLLFFLCFLIEGLQTPCSETKWCNSEITAKQSKNTTDTKPNARTHARTRVLFLFVSFAGGINFQKKLPSPLKGRVDALIRGESLSLWRYSACAPQFHAQDATHAHTMSAG